MVRPTQKQPSGPAEESLRNEIVGLKKIYLAQEEVIQKLNLKLDQEQRLRIAAERDAKGAKEESLQLRSELHASELRVAEFQGYIKALGDLEPPRMVSERQPRHINTLMRDLSGYSPHFVYQDDGANHREWWNRGR